MNVVIIEDEYPAAERLEKLLQRTEEDIDVVATLDSVEEAVRWLQHHSSPDLILSDIQLSDGLSFEIYEQVLVQSPIIFTTSYDEYAIRAFKLKSIDYLLKPIKYEELVQAIEKYRNFRSDFSSNDQATRLEQLLDNLSSTSRSYKKRFLVKKGERLIPISEEEIAYFYTENELVYLITKVAKKFVVDHTLEQLEVLLDPTKFFRINRQYILNISVIQQIHTYFSSRLKLQLHPSPSDEVFVSKGKVKDFKEWMERAG